MVWLHLQFISVQRRRTDELSLGERVVVFCLYPEYVPRTAIQTLAKRTAQAFSFS